MRRLGSAALSLFLATGSLGCASVPRGQPEIGSGWTDKPGWSAKRWMVAAANPLATDAGYRILEAGGSAIDAVVAVQMVLTLVEPQSSGIGGGGFLLHWDGREVRAFDGRESAPAEATETLFLRDGRKMTFDEAKVGGRSVGTPGILRMLEVAHRRYGKLPWAALFQPAIQLAEGGFNISHRLATILRAERFLMNESPARAYFYDAGGNPKPEGTELKNAELAAVLRELAARGADALYRGPLAREIVAKVRSHPTNPGVLSESDLAGYQAKERKALCFEYRLSRICGFPPPTSGGIALAQIFGILEGTEIARYKPTHDKDGRWDVPVQAVHLYSEAARLAFADRDQFVADSDYVPVPIAGLVDRDYLKERATLIGERSMGKAEPGVPPGQRESRAAGRTPELPSTSHISVVDAFGNALSMTTSVEDGFGSRQMVRGFLLNNHLTDFSFAPVDDAGRPVANRLQPGKRPRSSMSPVLVFDRSGKEFRMTLGSPGGPAIINYVGKVLLGTLDWGLNVQEAISLPNFGSRNGPTELERGRVSEALAEQLRSRGHDVQLIELTSGLQGIMRTPDGWFGGADPRREGIAKGE